MRYFQKGVYSGLAKLTKDNVNLGVYRSLPSIDSEVVVAGRKFGFSQEFDGQWLVTIAGVIDWNHWSVRMILCVRFFLQIHPRTSPFHWNSSRNRPGPGSVDWTRCFTNYICFGVIGRFEQIKQSIFGFVINLWLTSEWLRSSCL